MYTIFDIGAKTATEELAYAFAIELGLVRQNEPAFCNCGNNFCVEKGKDDSIKNYRYRCTRKNCRKAISVFENTVFEYSRIPISSLIKLIYLYCFRTPVTKCEDQVLISKKTCIKYYKLFRDTKKIIVDILSEEKLGGVGEVIEIDESHLFSRKNNQGRVLAGQNVWMIGGINRNTGKVFIKLSKKRNKQVLNEIILNNVILGSTIITDCWRGYNDLSNLGYVHKTVNHSMNFVSPTDHTIHTQTIERFWRDLKEKIVKNGPEKYQENYIDEYCYDREYFGNSACQNFETFIGHLKYIFAGPFIEMDLL